MPNHLIGEKSPYLLQHAHNPVDWYPWSETALDKARAENKPIFLSIGYATCHWCHVMAHESFEDAEVAAFLNRHFVSIKVDREERPDIDALYMAACQALTGQGGWPLSVFLTPDLKPFYAGTYFPRTGRFGLPGFLQVLEGIARLWQSQPEKVFAAADQVVGVLGKGELKQARDRELSEAVLHTAYSQLKGRFDPQWGGFGNAPKFPTPHQLIFLLRWFRYKGDSEALQMVRKTLREMRYGGIFDQVGFGFHRYSVDARWHVPHFEKMLYDQALLMMAYAEASLATRDTFYKRVAGEIFTYLRRDMTHPDGGFYSAEDADSAGVEGAFYLWTPKEATRVLGRDEGERVCRFFDIRGEGNFENGKSIPRIPVPPAEFAAKEGIPFGEWKERLESSRKRLFAWRDDRPHPLKDDKILTSWNGLMIAALAVAARADGSVDYIGTAEKAAAFLWDAMRVAGVLYHRFREGDVAIEGFLEDYAFLAWGFLELYEATFDTRYLERAVTLCEEMRQRFWDEARGGFFSASQAVSPLPLRRKEVYDGAVPSANSVALWVLLRLGALTGKTEYAETADTLIRAFAGEVSAMPMGYTCFLSGVFYALGPSREIIFSGNVSDSKLLGLMDKARENYDPHAALLLHDPSDARLKDLCPYLSGYPPANEGTSVAYVCEKGACHAPVSDVDSLEKILDLSSEIQ